MELEIWVIMDKNKKLILTGARHSRELVFIEDINKTVINGTSEGKANKYKTMKIYLGKRVREYLAETYNEKYIYQYESYGRELLFIEPVKMKIC